MNEKKIKLTSIKIALLGDSQVGKTAICQVLKDNKFDDKIISTIGYDKIDKQFKLENGSDIKVVIFDTAGQERFRAAALQTVRHVHGLVIVFDVTDRKTFDNIEHWLNVIKDTFDQPSMVLFGNKSDVDKKKWAVTEDELKIAAEKYKLTFFETSAKTAKNIDEGFSYVVNEAFNKIKGKENVVVDIRKKPKSKSGGCFGKKKKETNDK